MSHSFLDFLADIFGGNTNYGPLITEQRAISNIDAVELRCFGVLEIQQGTETSLVIEAQENIMPNVITEIIDRRLILRMDRPINQMVSIFSNSPGIIFHVVTNELHELKISGSGDAMLGDITTDRLSIAITGSGDVSTENITTQSLLAAVSGSGDIAAKHCKTNTAEISVHGSGDIKFMSLESTDTTTVQIVASGDIRIQDLRTNDLAAMIHGSGDIRFSGSAQKQHIRIRGSGDYRAGDLECGDTIVSIVGSGDAYVLAHNLLNAQITGSGDIYCDETPAEFSKKIVGSGGVHLP